MKVTLKTITPNAEVNIVEIARVSSTRTDKSEAPEGLINYLIKNKHWSPFEHSYMTIEIITSKAIGIQLLRHVSFRFQEFSQRYAKVTEIEPIELRKQERIKRLEEKRLANQKRLEEKKLANLKRKEEQKLANQKRKEEKLKAKNELRERNKIINQQKNSKRNDEKKGYVVAKNPPKDFPRCCIIQEPLTMA